MTENLLFSLSFYNSPEKPLLDYIRWQGITVSWLVTETNGLSIELKVKFHATSIHQAQNAIAEFQVILLVSLSNTLGFLSPLFQLDPLLSPSAALLKGLHITTLLCPFLSMTQPTRSVLHLNMVFSICPKELKSGT